METTIQGFRVILGLIIMGIGFTTNYHGFRV